ncbi:MAG: transporter permease [Chloroflexi bacterium]|nr:transporter permease [Chloroflexota bacterium]
MTAETAEVRTSSAPVPSTRPRVAGWRIVAGKELADHLQSTRFLILLLLLGAATLVPLYFASDTIKSVADQVTDARGAFLALFLASARDYPIPNVITFVAIVAPLLGVAFGFDAINTERSDGTLPRLLSQPIYRDDVVNGKFAAGLAVITVVLVAVVGVISGFGIVRLGIVPGADELIRLFLWVVVTIVWVGLWLAFGLLLSVRIRRPANAALIGFGVWALIVFFGQLIVGLVAGVIAPFATAATDEQYLALRSLSEQVLRILPLTLYQEASTVLMRPDVTTVSTPSTISQLGQLQQQAQGQFLSFDQSALLVWPHVVALVALTAVCFAAAYIWFMRQEVRA